MLEQPIVRAQDMLRPELLEYVKSNCGIPDGQARTMTIPTLQDIVKAHMEQGGPAGLPALPNVSEWANDLPNLHNIQPPTAPPVPMAPTMTAEQLRRMLEPEFARLTQLINDVRIEASQLPKPVEIHINNQPLTMPTGLSHVQFPKLLQRTLALRPVNSAVMLVGPAGSGKSYAGEQLAAAIGSHIGQPDLPFYAVSFGPSTQVHDFLGYMDAHGNYHSTSFYEAWRNGGVILLDELDAADSGILVTANAALSNGWCVFPQHGRVQRHEHCYIVAGANTYGRGATREYTGRQALDRATLNRFCLVDWPYDEKLELGIAGQHQAQWIKHVQKLRAGFTALGPSAPDILISPRASIAGAAVLQHDPTTSFQELENEFIWQGADEDDKIKVKRKAGLV